MPYTGDKLDVATTVTRISELAVERGFSVEPLPLSDCQWPLLALQRKGPEDAPRILLSAGIHGDEPAGPLAIQRLLEENALAETFHWVLFPMMSPGNLEASRRESQNGRDPNRDYHDPQTPEVQSQVTWLKEHGGAKFDAAFLLHEDWESPGFYLYEQCLLEVSSLAAPMLETAAVHCGLNLSRVIEDAPARGGLISFRGREPDLPEWPEAIYLMKQGSLRSYTLETPSCQPLPQRVLCHTEIVKTALSFLQK